MSTIKHTARRRPRLRRGDRNAVRLAFGFMACGALLGAAALTSPDANAYPSCGMGIPSISTPFGGFCDSQPIEPAGQHFHCQWGFGYELCEYRWADNTPAPFPGQNAGFGTVAR